MFWLYTFFACCFLCKYFQRIFMTSFLCFLLKLKRLQQCSQSTHLLYVYSSCEIIAIGLHLLKQWWQISALYLWCDALGITLRSPGAISFGIVTHKTHAWNCLNWSKMKKTLSLTTNINTLSTAKTCVIILKCYRKGFSANIPKSCLRLCEIKKPSGRPKTVFPTTVHVDNN